MHKLLNFDDYGTQLHNQTRTYWEFYMLSNQTSGKVQNIEEPRTT
jgi:hypothetical protein